MPLSILLTFYIGFVYYVKRNRLIVRYNVNNLIDKPGAMRYNCRCGMVVKLIFCFRFELCDIHIISISRQE